MKNLTGNNSHLAVMDKYADNYLYNYYNASIENKELLPDVYQEKLVRELQSIFDQLIKAPLPVVKKPFRRLFSIANQDPKVPARPRIKGLYVWGGVGRGKTHMVDMFFECLPINEKLRLHFHRFMQIVHEQLNTLKNVADPLQKVAEYFAERVRILCLDEMQVNDITDAMLLGNLYKHMFNLGITLVTTSNIRPGELYKNGLQREQFLPAIALLEEHTKVLDLSGETDYRLRMLEQTNLYQLTSEVDAEKHLEEYYHALVAIERHKDRKDVIVDHRHIPVKMWGDCVIWFTFDELCNKPLSVKDYIQITEFFKTVIISDIPVMDSDDENAAKRFINLIDVLYDHHVILVVTAEAKPEQLYKGNKLAFEFERTVSRLIEMQSHEYVASSGTATA